MYNEEVFFINFEVLFSSHSPYMRNMMYYFSCFSESLVECLKLHIQNKLNKCKYKKKILPLMFADWVGWPFQAQESNCLRVHAKGI